MKKKYILPAVKIFIAVVIAIALTKIAFFSGQEGQNQADISSGLEVTTRTTTATVGDITSTVEVKGQVVQDKAVEAKATLTGTVDSLTVAKDAMITQGEPLLYLKKTEPQEPKTDAEGNTVTPSDKVTWGTVYAPVSGKVTYNVIENQATTVGMVVASVTPQPYSATGTISAAQQYRLTNAPTAATLTLEGGPAPFQCNNLKVGTKASTSTTTGGDGSTTTTSGDGTSVEMRCAVPGDQKVFAGMPVTISVDAGSASEALMVPVTAVEGKVGSGFVWLVPESGDASKAVKTAVKLGITDGTNIQITAGLKADQQVLQFVPNKDTRRTGTPDTCEPDNSACYDSEGKEIL